MDTSDNDDDNNSSSNSSTNNNTNTNDGTSSIFPIPVAQRVKRCGWDFYENTLGAPKYVVSQWLNRIFFFISFHSNEKRQFFYTLVNQTTKKILRFLIRLLLWWIKVNWRGDYSVDGMELNCAIRPCIIATYSFKTQNTENKHFKVVLKIDH